MSGYTFDFVNKLSNPNPSSLGGGLSGGVGNGLGKTKSGLIGGGGGPNGSSGMIGSQERATDRMVLRKAFGNSARDYINSLDKTEIYNFFIGLGWPQTQAKFFSEISAISPLAISNSQIPPKIIKYGESFGFPSYDIAGYWNRLHGKGSFCGKFRVANSLGDPLVSLIGGGSKPNNWFGNISNPLSGKSLNGVKKGDNVSTNNLSFNEWMNLVNAEIPRNEKWADKASYVEIVCIRFVGFY